MQVDQRRRPTVGVLAGWQFYWTATPLSYLNPLFEGLRAAARDADANLLLAGGIGLAASPDDPFRPAWPGQAPDADFVPIGPWNTDGLIVVNPLHSPARSRYIQDLIAAGHPVLFAGSGEGRPEIIADNAQGIQQAVQHLASHGSGSKGIPHWFLSRHVSWPNATDYPPDSRNFQGAHGWCRRLVPRDRMDGRCSQHRDDPRRRLRQRLSTIAALLLLTKTSYTETGDICTNRADGSGTQLGRTISAQADGGQPVRNLWGPFARAALILAGGVAGGCWLGTRRVEALHRTLDERAANRNRHLAALNAVTAVASQSLRVQETLDGALEKTLEVTGLEAGGIYLLNGDGQLMTVGAHRGLDASLVQAIDNLKVDEGFSGHVAQTGEPLIVQNIASDPRLTRLAVREMGFRALLAVPLAAHGRVLGTMFLITRRDREFSQPEIELLASTGRQIGMAVENARLYEETRNRLAQLAALQKTNRALVSTLELNVLLETIIQQAATLFQADAGILNLVDWDKMEDEVVAVVGSIPNLLGTQAPLDCTLSGWVTLHKQPVISNRLREDPRVNSAAQEHFSGLPLRNAAVVPLMVKDRAVGTLALINKLGGEGEFDPADLDLLISFANQAVTAMENARLFTQEQRRAEQFRVIAEVGHRFTLTLDINDLLHQVVELIQQAFGYYHVGIGLIEEDEVVYRVGAGELWDNPQFQFKPSRLKVGVEGLTGWVAGHGQPLLAQDVSQEPRYVWMQGSLTRSELALPINAKGQTIGVLDVQSDRQNAFDDKDVHVLQTLAHQAGAAIENARLYAAEQRRAEQFRVLTEVSRRISSLASVDEMLEQITSLVQNSFGYTHVGVGLVEGNEVVSKAEAGAFADAYRSIHIPLGQGSWGWVAEQGEPLRSPDVRQDQRPHHMQETGYVRSQLCVPLKLKGEVIGVLSAASDRLDAFDDSDQVILQSVANQASTAIENARLYEQAQQLAVMQERSRLARDLHDSVTQALYGITLYSQAASAHLAGGRVDKAAEHLRELQATSQDALAEMRLLIFELRPPILAEEGLATALQARLSTVEGRAGLKTEFKSELSCRLPPVIEEGLYRIAHEALNNCLKHAHARRIVVQVGRDDQRVTLTVADDGVGFDPAAVRERGGLGLPAMAERAAQLGGRLSVKSKLGEGTEVRVEAGV